MANSPRNAEKYAIVFVIELINGQNMESKHHMHSRLVQFSFFVALLTSCRNNRTPMWFDFVFYPFPQIPLSLSLSLSDKCRKCDIGVHAPFN